MAQHPKISILFVVTMTLLLVGVVPLVLTGWLMADRSARALRSVEGRYQTQLVQDKARQIEMFGQRYCDLVESFARALELSGDMSVLSSQRAQQKLGQTLQANPNLDALYVKPVTGPPLVVSRPEANTEAEIGTLANEALSRLGEKPLYVGSARLVPSSGDLVITVAAPVISGDNISAAVVAVVSLREISRIMSESRPSTDDDLWKGGLPIIFVVDENGRAVFYPDASFVKNQKSMAGLKIVEEWLQSNRQIQSALLPFNAEHEGKNYGMIGAYSTASLKGGMSLGVIAMQDESRALGSVAEMRRQIWLTSLALAVIALILGSFFARRLTRPILELVAAARKIADGDLSIRIPPRRIKEVEALGATFNVMSGRLEDYIASLAKAAEENRELFVGTVKALAAAIDGKDKYTRGHSERVARFSVAIGKRLGISADELEKLRISALLHDVGKIAIDDAILKKPAALTAEEFEIMKTHPQRGYKIMSNIPAMKDFLAGMYMHHEMVNGEGYPQGLKGNEIPLQAKIVSVADTFDAMTTDRPYQKGMKLQAALDRIQDFVGTRYDPDVVDALIAACCEGSIRPVSAGHYKSVSPSTEAAGV
jgi:HD-GYP domain-containing protein (c-di-GMP phosphodiesterase class II)